MKNRRSLRPVSPARLFRMTLAGAVLFSTCRAAFGADGIWFGGTGTQEWSDPFNWSVDPPPGATLGTTSPDTASFDSNAGATEITIDAGRNVKSLDFLDGSGGFTIGSAGANAGEALHLSSGGSIKLESATATGITINAPLVLEAASGTTAGTYTFNNDHATTAGTTTTDPKLTIAGGISGGTTTSTITLTLAGRVGLRNGGNSSQALAQSNLISGVISDGGAAGGLSVTVNGISTGNNPINAWNLTGANTFSGNVTVSTGVLYFNTLADIGVASSLGTGTNGTIIAGGNVIYLGGTTSSNRTITGAGASFYNNGTGTLTLTGAITLSSSITFRGNNTIIIDGLITGPSGLGKTNGNTVALTNTNNSFGGNLTISAGTVSITSIANSGANSSIGAGNTISLGQNQTSDNVGTLQFTGASGGSSDRSFVINSGTNNSSAGQGVAVIENTVAGQTLALSGTVRASGGLATNYSALDLAGAGDGIMSGVIGGLTSAGTTPANIKVTKKGTGTWTLSGANIYYGITYVQAGVLNIQNSLALGGTAGGDTKDGTTLGGTEVSNNATLQLQGGIAVGAEDLSIAGSGASGQTGALVNVSGDNSYGGQLTLTSNTTLSSDSGSLDLTNSSAMIGGNRALTLAGAGNGRLAAELDTTVTSVTKTGAGIWTLSTQSGYTGATTIDGGTLNVTGGLSATSGVSVANGATLAGDAAISGAVTIANGGLAAGDARFAGSTGTLALGAGLTLGVYSHLDYDLGTFSDLVTVSGDVTLDGILNVAAGTGLATGTKTLLTYSGALTDNTLEFGNMASGYNYALDTGTPGQVDLNIDQAGLEFWDGSNLTPGFVANGRGGTGTWNSTNTNWTNPAGDTNSAWGSTTAVFAGAAGTVSVAETVNVGGLQFATAGYEIASSGGDLNISAAQTEVRTDSGITTISAKITGTGGLFKTNTGTLVLSGANDYAGGTRVNAGTLVIGADDTLPTTTDLILGSAVDGSAVGLGTLTANLDVSSHDQTIGSLQIASNNSVDQNIVTIGVGQTLTISGAGGLKVGVANSAQVQTLATFNGGGTLEVNNPSAIFEVGLEISHSPVPGGNPTFDHSDNLNRTTADFTALGSLIANVNQFRAGYAYLNQSTVLLSDSSNNITANSIQVSNSANGNAGNGILVLGAGTNVLTADAINIGTSKGNGILKFASQAPASAGTVTIQGKSGAGADITVGSTTGTATGAFPSGVLDLRGHVATVTADDLIVGERDTQSGGANGTVYFDGGTFTANTVTVGAMSGDSTNTATGTLVISNGAFTVNSEGSFTLATFDNTITSGKAQGTVNITGGSLTSNVDILEGGGANSNTTNTVSTINLNGGTLDLTGHTIGDATNTINNLTFAAGTLQNVAEINGGASLEKTTSNTLNLGGANTYTGATNVNAGTVVVTGSLNGTASVNVSSGTTLSTDALGSITTSGGNVAITGTLAPGGRTAGSDAGTLSLNLASTGKLDFAASSNLLFGLGGTSDLITFNTPGDWLAGSGNATLQLDVTLAGFDYNTPYYTIFQNVTTPGFEFADITGYDTINQTAYFFQVGTDYVVSFTIPEPGQTALLLSGLAPMLMFRRRRRS